MSETQGKRTVIQEAVDDGWEIVGLVPKITGGSLLHRSAAIVLKNEQGHLRRIDVNPNSIPEYENTEQTKP